MVYVFLAEGFEECEALAPVDILRRGGVEVRTVGVGTKTVVGSHGIPVTCDITEDEVVTDGLQAVILPGGMPGTLGLKASETVRSFLTIAHEQELLIGAICAAPSVLGSMGFLKGKRAVCYPGFENELLGAEVVNESVVRDGQIITAVGAGAAFAFSLALLAALKDEKQAEKIRGSMKITG